MNDEARQQVRVDEAFRREAFNDWSRFRVPRIVSAKRMDVAFTLDEGNKWSLGKAGDFITVDESGKFRVVPGDTFEAFYEEV